MKTELDCFPCFLKQTVIAIRQYPGGEAFQRDIFRDVLSIMQEADTSRPPAYITTFIHRAIRNRLAGDPFQKIKSDFNNIALGYYPGLKELIKKSEDPLLTACRLAIAGNIIDFGIFTSVDIGESIRRSIHEPLAVDEYALFRKDVEQAGEILYLLDNSGEIVFDRLLIEELKRLGKRVRAVVKGSPVLNDVTREDAVQSGLWDVCDVMDNGSDAVGTILPWTSADFRKEFEKAELIISKGQGNFETLTGTDKKTYFLFQSKCEVVSKELGLSLCSMIMKRS